MEKENKHHIQQRKDRRRLPRNFDLHAPSNTVMLPVETHNELHAIMNSNPDLKDNLNTRVYMANMAYNDSLQDVPEGLYFTEIKVR